MKYKFRFYEENDYDDLVRLSLLSYQWDCPVTCLSRMEFCRTLERKFSGKRHGWENTVGMYLDNDKIVACVWNEGSYGGDVFFLFDKKEWAEDRNLIADMVKYAKTYAAGLKEDGRTRWLNLMVPEWHDTLKEYVVKHGFTATDWYDSTYVLPYLDKDKETQFEVQLPEGYRIVDGYETKADDQAKVHRLSFNYGAENHGTDHGEEAFLAYRQCEHYDRELDLCIYDEMGRPVAFTTGWFDDKMPYAELEPLAVVWWERRRGLATALIHEMTNRIRKKYPQCKGLRGGDQEFYKRLGFECWGRSNAYYWEAEIIISWEKESEDKRYWENIL